MTSLLLRRPLLGLGLPALALASGTSLLLLQHRHRTPLLLDSALSAKDWSVSQYQRDARVPVVTSDGRLNRSAVKQISAGSITGVIAGLAVATFSKTLALLLGLLIFGVAALEARGIHIVPYKRLQSRLGNVDLRSLVQDNAAFKLSLGATFALAGFAEF